MLNPLRKKRIRVDTMPNSLLREINGFWSRYHALRLANNEYHDMVVALCILLLYLSMISGGYRSPTLYSYYFNSIFLSHLIQDIFLGIAF